MKSMALVVLGTVALIASLAMACGGDEAPAAPREPGTGGTVSGSGMIAPDTYLTYNGQRYELVNMLFESMAAATEFEAVGEASQSDIDMKGDMRVFERGSDTTAVFTYSAPTADDQGMWLAWRLVG